MIFKPKVKQKVNQFFVKMPVFMLLALVCLVGHPTRAEAKTVLEPYMTHFVTIGEYDIIETSGENLNKMFDIKANNKSELNDDRQYIAYYKIDKQKTSKTSWSTYYNYWHSEKWGESVPTKDKASSWSGYIFGYQVKDTSNSKHVPNTGKKTFYHYKPNVNDKSKKHVGYSDDGRTMIGTLHYFSVDSDTVTGKKLAKVMKEHPERDYVDFYISPIISTNDGHYYYSCRSWYNHVWRDRNYSNYQAHYDQEVRLKLPHVKVTTDAYIIGKQKSEDSDMLYQGGELKKRSSGSAVNITDSMYLWGADEDKELNLRSALWGAEYHSFTDETYRIVNPIAMEDPSDFTHVNLGNGKKQKLMCVGYRVSKIVKDSRGNKSSIILASTMIEMHKGTSGDYLPYYVEEKNQDASKADTAGAQTISIPKNVNSRTVTVKRFDKYGKSSSGKAVKDTTFKKNEEVKVSKWLKEINKPIYWGNFKALGIRNESNDKTVSISVRWFYAPYDDVEEASKVTLEQYYTSEDTNISTKEFPSVDDSADLSYKHNSSNKKNELKYTKTLATVNEGDPWVSYNVEQKGESYKLKDGTYSPKSRYSDSKTLTVTRTKKKNAKKFQNTDPTCDFTKKDLVEKKDANSGLSNSKIPLVLNKTGKNGNSATCNNYLYKIVVTTNHDEVWTEFTAEDIWCNTTPANGKIVKNKSTNRSYTTYAPYMKSYVYVTGSSALNLKAKTSDWQKDAYDMTHFIIPEVRGEVKIKAYYASTMPVRTFVYKKTEDGGSYNLVQSETKVSWVSPSVHYRGTYNDGYKVDAIIAATGTHTASKPYTTKQYKKGE